MQITHYGHAALLVDTGNNRILFDPGVFDRSWKSIKDLNTIVITHAHADHVDAEGVATLTTEKPHIKVFAESEAVAALRDAGVSATTLRSGDHLTIGGDELMAVGGTHACIHEDLGESGNVGILLRSNDRTLFHPGDDINTVPEDIDVLALPLSAPWGALKDTVEFLRAVNPSKVIPIHDALLSETGRSIFLARITALGPDTSEFLDGRDGRVLRV